MPLMVFSFAILKGIGARGDLKFLLHSFFRPMGGAADELTDSVMQFVTNMRGELLGSIGLAVLIYTVITAIQKIEASFNFVWRVERPRSIGRRFSEYLSVMIVGPILLAVAIGLLGSAEHSPFAQWLHALAPIAAVLGVFAKLVPYVIVAAVFTFMYSFIPNTHVEFRAAVIGGVTAGIIWALVGQVFTAVILASSNMVAVEVSCAATRLASAAALRPRSPDKLTKYHASKRSRSASTIPIASLSARMPQTAKLRPTLGKSRRLPASTRAASGLCATSSIHVGPAEAALSIRRRSRSRPA